MMIITKAQKIAPDPHLSQKEKDFVAFCDKSKIKYEKQESKESRGVNDYKVTFRPDFIDKHEQLIIDYCEKHNVPYTFVRDKDGYHHYSFGKMIDLTEKEKFIPRKSIPDSCCDFSNPTLRPTHPNKEKQQKLQEEHKALMEEAFQRDWGDPRDPVWYERWFFPGWSKDQVKKKDTQNKMLVMAGICNEENADKTREKGKTRAEEFKLSKLSKKR